MGNQLKWTSVIKNTGPADALIWRHPEEDFNTNSTLVVMPGEHAIFVSRGEIEAIYEPGTYRLSTGNYPFLSQLAKVFSGGVSTFNSVIYYVNTTKSAEIRWGTESPIRVRDKILGLDTRIGAHGAYTVQIVDPAKFMSWLTGSKDSIESPEELTKFFRSQFQGLIKSTLTEELQAYEGELLNIEALIPDLSNAAGAKIDSSLELFGLRCISFAIASMSLQDDALRRRYDERESEYRDKIRAAEGDAAVIETLGANWDKVKASEVLKEIAKGQDASSATGAGIGLGIAASEITKSLARHMTKPATNAQPTAASNNEPTDIELGLIKLKDWFEKGLITEEEYDAKRAELLAKI